MAKRMVGFDKESEQVLSEVPAATGLPISAAIKSWLRALQARVRLTPVRSAYEVYNHLDLGPGGYAIAASSDTRAGVQLALRRKHRR
jgi:hypothetical protein